MNKLFLLLTCLLFLSFQSDAQEEEYSYIDVKWKVGDSKVIAQIDSSFVYQNEEVIVSNITHSNYSIKIVSQTDSTYEVLFKEIMFDPELKMESDLMDVAPVKDILNKTYELIQQKLKDYEYSFIVDKNTAMAIDIAGMDAQITMMNELTNSIVDLFYPMLQEQPTDMRMTREEFQVKMDELMSEKMDEVLQTMINSFNYVFQTYSNPYIEGKTLVIDAELTDINQVQHGDLEPSQGKLLITGKKKGSSLFIDTEYEYDKQMVYDQMIASQGKASEIPIEEFELSERIVSEFDTKTSWLKKSKSIVKVNMAMIRVYNSTYLVVK